jgi:glutaredoxin
MAPRVTLYSRKNCHLCALARAAIAGSGAEGYVLEEVDIDNDPELRDRYTDDVPVVSVDGVDLFWHHVEPREFRHAIERTTAPARDGHS